jgi:hypothetical protein
MVKFSLKHWVETGQLCMWEGCACLASEIHHIKPRKHGGSNSPSNLIALCRGHHDPPASQIHIDWKKWAPVLRGYRNKAIPSKVRREFVAKLSRAREYRANWRMAFAMTETGRRFNAAIERLCRGKTKRVVYPREWIHILELTSTVRLSRSGTPCLWEPGAAPKSLYPFHEETPREIGQAASCPSPSARALPAQSQASEMLPIGRVS